MKKKILIVDFGSQVTKLIARRIRDFGVYCEIINIEDTKNNTNFDNAIGVILSGGPATVTNKNFPNIPYNIFNLNIPILGICYGLQLITKAFGGIVKSNKVNREFGRAIIFEKKKEILFG